VSVLGFRQRSLHPLSRRVRDALRFGRRLPRSQRVYAVEVGGHRYKRVVLPDAHHAAAIAARLRRFGPDGIYPALILERERELWVEFIEGTALSRSDPEAASGVAHVLAALQRRDPRLVPLAQTSFLHDLQVDLRFLGEVGVLPDASLRGLRRRAEQLAPERVWVGYDCTDAIAKNFVRTPEDRVRAVDVESLGAEQLIGVGPAKACLRWLSGERERFLAALAGAGAPDFQAYFEFVELAFLAFWTKSSLLEGKRRFVDPGAFERFSSHGRAGA
jgi:hypothetical protein